MQILIAILVGIAITLAGYYKGHGDGVDKQKVVDQVQFDRINGELTKQKTEANAKYRLLSDKAIADMAKADTDKSNLEKDNVKNKKIADDARRAAAGSVLRFTTTREAAGCGPSSGGAPSAEAKTPGPDATVIVSRLPDVVGQDLQELVFSANKLRADYQTCYDWANRP